MFPINSGVSQGSVLGPTLYLLFTSDLPQAPNITIGIFADDIVILTCHNDTHRASSCFQEYLLKLQSWLQTWKIKINVSKSTYLTFTLRNDPSPTIHLNNVKIPPAATVIYLGLHLDNMLKWKVLSSRNENKWTYDIKNSIGYFEGNLTYQQTINSCCTNP